MVVKLLNAIQDFVQNFYTPVKVKISSIDNRFCVVNVIRKGVCFCNLSSLKMIHAFKFQHFIAVKLMMYQIFSGPSSPRGSLIHVP